MNRHEHPAAYSHEHAPGRETPSHPHADEPGLDPRHSHRQ
jgi:hypothetical protein